MGHKQKSGQRTLARKKINEKVDYPPPPKALTLSSSASLSISLSLALYILHISCDCHIIVEGLPISPQNFCWFILQILGEVGSVTMPTVLTAQLLTVGVAGDAWSLLQKTSASEGLVLFSFSWSVVLHPYRNFVMSLPPWPNVRLSSITTEPYPFCICIPISFA